jgi:prephenate dehydrogenase
MTQITIIGLGLMGGSIACALKQTSFAGLIVAYDANTAALQTAMEVGLIDEAIPDLGKAVQNADYIVIATPLTAYQTIFKTIRLHLQHKPAIITDVGSVKGCVIQWAQQELRDAFPYFVPGHPIAGGEKSGVEATTADLFQDKLMVLTPTSQTNQQAVTKIKKLWEKIGARVELMDANLHDEILAATSHMPQMLVSTFMKNLEAHPNFPQLLKYTGSGFKDFTRIANSNAALWTGITLNNRAALLQELQQFRQHLDELISALTTKNESALRAFFTAL